MNELKFTRIFEGLKNFHDLEGKLWTELDETFTRFGFRRINTAGVERKDGFVDSEAVFPISTYGLSHPSVTLFRPQLYVPISPRLGVVHIVERYDVERGQVGPEVDREGAIIHNINPFVDLNDPNMKALLDSAKRIYLDNGFVRGELR